MQQSANFRRPTGLRTGGWRLTLVLTGVVLGVALLMIFGIGGSDGARFAIRFSARASLILFLAAFMASALNRLWPSNAARWLVRNRRYLGAAFAGSHLVHALAIGAYVMTDAHAFYASQQPLGYVLNGVGYFYILAMAATSFRRPAQAIGPVAWRWLHLTGGYYIWFAFAKSYFPRAVHHGFFAPFAIALILVLAMRIAVVLQGTRLKPAQGQGAG